MTDKKTQKKPDASILDRPVDSYDAIRPVWQAQRQAALSKITQTPSIGDPNSPFNKRVDARNAKEQERPRTKDGRYISSTRVTAQKVNPRSPRMVPEGSRGASR